MAAVIALFITVSALLAVVTANQVPTSEIHRIYLQDQSDRGVGGKGVPGKDLWTRDSKRRARAHELLAQGDLRTAEDFHDAAFIFQHSAASDDYPVSATANDFLLAHVLANVAVQKGDTKSLWISAASLDRYLQAIGQPQVFGTQYQSKGNSPYTQEPYNRTLVPDALRAVFCVPSIQQQGANVEEFNAGKYPAGILPPGCVR